MAAAATEHQIQAALIRWRDLRASELPELLLLFAVPNGGKRDPATAWRLQAEGVTPGVPDLLLLVPRHGYHGLAIEMKTAKGTRSNAQREFMERLDEAGYSTWVARSWPDAAQRILWYLGADSSLAPER
jgi:hypothetical protein